MNYVYQGQTYCGQILPTKCCSNERLNHTDPCRTGWKRFGGKCFYFSGKGTYSWLSAENKCKAMHSTAHLASIGSKQEGDWVSGKNNHRLPRIFYNLK